MRPTEVRGPPGPQWALCHTRMRTWTSARRHAWLANVAIAAGVVLAGCQDGPAPRFEAPLVSGVVTLPMPSTQRFDTLLSGAGALAALRGSDPRLKVDMVDGAVLIAHVTRTDYEPSILGMGVSAMEAILERGNRLVVGSGFVSVFNPVSPLGLLQLDGKIESELTPHGYTRILGVRTAGLAVVGRSDYHPGMFEAAVQVGPGIIQSAKLDILQRERNLPPYVRAFVATCEDRWLAGIAQQPTHLYDLGELLLAYFEAETIACDEVVNLSGDREALLAIMSEDGQSIAYFGNPTLPKASIIAFGEPTD